MIKLINWHTLIKRSLPYLFSMVLVAAIVIAYIGSTQVQAGTEQEPTQPAADAAPTVEVTAPTVDMSGIEAEKQALAKQQQELKAAMDAFNKTQADAEKVLDEKLAEIANQSTQLDEKMEILNQQSAQMNTLLESVEKAGAAVSDKIAQLEGAYDHIVELEQQRWIQPIQYVELTSPFGYRTHPVTGEIESYHSGVDLAAYVGTPVVAARSGTVKAATYDSSAGYYVNIDHMDGYGTRYLHLQKYIVEVGQFVFAGQIIGYSGNSGVSTGPHLHFSIYKNDVAVDPAAYITLKRYP